MPITKSYNPNVYIPAHLIRSTESLDRDTLARAFGVMPVKVNTDANRLTVELTAPDEIRPKTTLQVKFQDKGQENNHSYVTIAAVDEGICQLTDFQTPDAHTYFFGKKRLAVESNDIYGVVLPEIASSLTSVAVGIEAKRKRHLTPVSVTRVQPVAFCSGLVKTDTKGSGKVSFKIPQFNGSLRLMAVVNKLKCLSKFLYDRLCPLSLYLAGGSVEENAPVQFTLPSDWIAGTTDFKLTVSSFPAVNFAGSLQSLLRYPHGYVEQTTSRLFPLLYCNDLARLVEAKLFNRTSADYYIEEGIAKLENMQLVSGAFSYWPTGGYINNWSSVYAAHFLVEALKAGYVVSDRVYNRLINALREYTRDYRASDTYSYQTAM